MEITKRQGGGPVGPDRLKLHDEAVALQDFLHLEYESFCLFGTIFLDRVACFIEGYFGKPAKEGRIDKHRSL